MKVLIDPQAAADIARLREFLAEADEVSARRAVQAILVAIRSLSVLPERGRKSSVRGFRELVVRFGRSAYIVRYVFQSRRQTVLVTRIWHSRERRS